jgi:hypothetical protein
MESFFVLGLLIIGVGATGLTRKGLFFRAKKRITGTRGRMIGASCILLGMAGVLAAFWGSPVKARGLMAGVLLGIVLGHLWTWLAMRD